jgi:hypothetical protein
MAITSYQLRGKPINATKYSCYAVCGHGSIADYVDGNIRRNEGNFSSRQHHFE